MKQPCPQIDIFFTGHCFCRAWILPAGKYFFIFYIRDVGDFIASDTGPLYLIPLTICNGKARTLAMRGSCLTFPNRFCKVYSERSCLICVLSNKIPHITTLSKGEVFIQNKTNPEDKYRINSREKVELYRSPSSSLSLLIICNCFPDS